MRSMKRHPLIFGTILLTSAGLICRFMGFFYRIYLSRVFDAEGMGIYSLIMPVMGLCFSLTGACFQTCISKFVAEQKENGWKALSTGLCLCLPLAFLITVLLYSMAEPISNLWLLEPRCKPLLQILSLSVFPSALHSCLKGYYYGKQKTVPPALCQILEQVIRISTVFLLVARCEEAGTKPPLLIMVIGLVLGELSSMAFSLLFMLVDPSLRSIGGNATGENVTIKAFLVMLFPLLSNRIILNVLQSMETVALPLTLEKFGYSRSDALSVYGVFTGMVMPLLFFPTTLTGSISVLLLPNVAKYQASGEREKIKSIIHKTAYFCVFLGMFAIGLFFTFGPFIGTHIYENELAGTYIRIASFISPFLYLNSTFSGILQGLGKTPLLFLINVSGLIFRLILIHLLVPMQGIQAYLYIVLFTQLLQSMLYYRSLRAYL